MPKWTLPTGVASSLISPTHRDVQVPPMATSSASSRFMPDSYDTSSPCSPSVLAMWPPMPTDRLARSRASLWPPPRV